MQYRDLQSHDTGQITLDDEALHIKHGTVTNVSQVWITINYFKLQSF